MRGRGQEEELVKGPKIGACMSQAETEKIVHMYN